MSKNDEYDNFYFIADYHALNSLKTKEEMNEFFEDFKREKTPPYAVFQADDADTVITLYESGKAVFQGRDADLSSQFWIERERHNNPLKKVEVTNSENKDKTNLYPFVRLRGISWGVEPTAFHPI